MLEMLIPWVFKNRKDIMKGVGIVVLLLIIYSMYSSFKDGIRQEAQTEIKVELLNKKDLDNTQFDNAINDNLEDGSVPDYLKDVPLAHPALPTAEILPPEITEDSEDYGDFDSPSVPVNISSDQ